MNQLKKITGIILAGGKSQRMGQDKGLMIVNNKPFIQHIIDALMPLTHEIIIVSNTSAYDTFAIKRVEDHIPNAGPIAGIHAGLMHSKTVNNIILSCDVPMITTSLLEKLTSYKNDDYDVVQFEANRKTMPLIALYKKRCAAYCLDVLSRGEKRLRTLISEMNTKTIVLPKKDWFLVHNINTVTDLKTIIHAIDH
ncbi:molybdenum cofactor guanylyltransferase [Aquimarina sp. U1-2]|uniref:molybdenum cofactor guanylyltransferase n=1 Tax=Aquimarina sp. U1-2 TaxID=2823141 RepID=UPI001AEC948E|nr:molybdenum cofactor guanylyltransferase [Aquimarina sp. U1-2]MBP2831506.1 molybdenum cofactor guanylyltransferase [Aquimarina sp. U1-2]